MLRKTSFCIVLILILSLSAGCAANTGTYENMSTGENEDSVTIVRGDTTYLFYGFVSGHELTGTQIGILDDDTSLKVYQVNGYADTDWLLVQLDVVMERGTCSLYRAEHVTDIPADFVLDDDPGSFFLANYS